MLAVPLATGSIALSVRGAHTVGESVEDTSTEQEQESEINRNVLTNKRMETK